MSFSDLMKKPLPSQTVVESAEDEFDMDIDLDTMTESEYVTEVMNVVDVVLESFEDTDMFTEGANWDLHKKYRADLKKFKTCMKTAKKLLKGHEYNKARAEINDGIAILKHCQKEATKDIRMMDEGSVVSAICGFFLRNITFMCKYILLLLLCYPLAGIAYLIRDINDIVKIVQKSIKDGWNIGNLNTYVNFVESDYDRMIKVLEKFLEKLDSAEKEYNTAVKDADVSKEEIKEESVQDELDAMIAFVTENSGEEFSGDKMTDDLTKEVENMDKGMATEDSDNDEDDVDEIEDLDDIDLSGLSDEELDEMEEDLRDSDLDDAAGDVDPVELTADEEREADDLMSLAGTTELLKSELNVEERTNFLESATETQIAVFEGFLLESDVLPISDTEEDDVVTEAKLYNKTTVRFSKEDRKQQLYAVALNVSARAHNDPDFIKLQRVQKVRRVLKKRIQKKYHNEAIKRMKVYFNRLRSSKSSVLAAIGKKITGNKD
jgi:hypothetical protein